MTILVRRPIQELSENVIHKIAAGEVVERPVSVVKELVENSLDAEATRIRVELEQGGLKRIRITDNGIGIPVREMPLALKRHATSKICSSEDLFSLHTLGFRGEALPSIASVSRFCLESATQESDPIAYVLEVKEGRVGTLQETSMPRGTRITVDDLFCTVPARLKFLKRPETEWGHVFDLMTALALGYPQVEWELLHNGKRTLFCPISSDPRDRVLDLFGSEARERLYPVEREVSGIRLSGLLGHPNFNKKNNRHLFVYINGRYVHDRLLNHAILSGYRNLLMQHQYPVVILNLQVDPALVDVNVHPTKREVRFSNSNSIHHLISETLHHLLETAPWRETIEMESSARVQGEAESVKGSVAYLSSDEMHKASSSVGEGWIEQKRENRPVGGAVHSSQHSMDFRGRIQSALEDFSRRQELEISSPLPQAKIGTLPFSQLRVIGQFRLTYILCEYEGSLILIDQHAAHERIGFEQLRRSLNQGPMPQQRLLTPLTFTLGPSESARLKTSLSSLEKLGLEVEDYGHHSFVLKAVPALLQGADCLSLIRELAETLEQEGESGVFQEKLDHVLATMACHRQVRAGDKLNREEMLALLHELEGTPRGYHCPHGRPVMVELPHSQIERWFKRIV